MHGVVCGDAFKICPQLSHACADLPLRAEGPGCCWQVTQQLHVIGALLEAVCPLSYKASIGQLWWQPRRNLPQNIPHTLIQNVQGKVAQPLQQARQQALARAASPVAVTGTNPCCGQHPWRGRSNALPCMPIDF